MILTGKEFSYLKEERVGLEEWKEHLILKAQSQ
jgi:hypothetical protein